MVSDNRRFNVSNNSVLTFPPLGTRSTTSCDLRIQPGHCGNKRGKVSSVTHWFPARPRLPRSERASRPKLQSGWIPDCYILASRTAPKDLGSLRPVTRNRERDVCYYRSLRINDTLVLVPGYISCNKQWLSSRAPGCWIVPAGERSRLRV